MTTRQIIVSGGGLVEQSDYLIDCYLLAQTTAKIPKVLLLPTASGDSSYLITHFKQLWSQYPCEPSVLSFFHGSLPNLEEIILKQDLILVSGGNTKSMLGVWKEWGLDRVLQQAYQQGVVLAGGSAGAVCWFDSFITDAFAGRFTVHPGLGFLPYSCCPHYSLKARREAFKQAILEQKLGAGYGITDHSVLHFQDEKFFRGITAIPNQSAHYLERITEPQEQLQPTKVPIQSVNDEEIQSSMINAPCFASLISQSEEDTHNDAAT